MQNSGFIWILAAVGVYGVVHSILASHTVKRWAERQGGGAARRFYRLIFVMLGFLTLLPLLALVVYLPDQNIYAIPFPWVLLTLAFQGLAVLGLLRAVGETGMWDFIGLAQMSDPQPLNPQLGPQKLVTGGYYRSVRHPIYSFTLILLWLLPYMSWNLLALVIGFTLYILVGTWFEERKLAAEFGPAYDEYRAGTKMLIPWVL
jgi:protein-S-isoprenylcysteine O-methyltransferase Ste14